MSILLTIAAEIAYILVVSYTGLWKAPPHTSNAVQYSYTTYYVGSLFYGGIFFAVFAFVGVFIWIGHLYPNRPPQDSE